MNQNDNTKKDNVNWDNASAPEPSAPKTRQVKVWDLLVRVTHWTVAAGIIANLFFTKDGSELHEFVGYTVLGLVVIRLLWGLVGTRYARFTSFFPTPSRLKQHLLVLKSRREDDQHLGHNPLAALMMLSLWAVIIGLGVTGYLMEANLLFDKDLLEESHEILANSLYLLVPVHIIAAIVMSYWQRQNLIKSMITSKKTVIDKPSSMN